MTRNIINYYACGNTAKGFFNLFDNNLLGLRKVFILKGGPGTGKSTLIKRIGDLWAKTESNIEYIHCPSDNGSLDGIINTNRKIAIVDGTSPHVIEPTAPGAIDEYVNLGVSWDSSKLELAKAKIIDLNCRISDCYKNAYAYYGKALAIHDEWEKIYIDNMNFNKADKLSEKVIELLIKDRKIYQNPIVKHRFLGAATPKGPVDFIENLTSEISKRYFLKGRPGSGKSTLLKKLANKAISDGFNVEIYHCGFDPDSLDMIILRELDVCIFDSTSPHEYFPSRDDDEIIDMYKELIVPGTDEKYKEKLDNIKLRYKSNIGLGNSYLKTSKGIHDELEKYYINAIDFSKIDEIREELIYKLSKYE
ncbi:PRK06851 family protein [Clostridium sediminicola]|uniref:PRK06851 family protein n=1 Tax=Clostridium sediminicola TaxID=3114879 RepID=UPI0031F27C79